MLLKIASPALALLICSTTALKAGEVAADPPVLNRSGFYASIDGSHQTINLPTYDLGWKLRHFNPEVNLGPSETYNPRISGFGISGAIGYVVPEGAFSSAWGQRVRFEIDAAYTDADGTAGGRGPDNDGFAAQLLDGSFGETNGFGPSSGVHTRSTLTTDYTAWNVGFKAAADHRFGAFTLTPSLATFGGQASNDQSFYQELGSGSGPGSRNYRAASSLQWTDWGARFGLDGKWQVTNWLSLGAGGSVGTAWRDTSMSAADEYNLLGPFAFTAYSQANENRDVAPLLATAEVSASLQLVPGMELKAFGGLNFDSSVPGVSASTYTGSASNPTAVTSAGIKLESETSYYAGGRLTIGFAP